MDLKRLQANFDRLGQARPLEATFDPPGHRRREWDVAEYFASGESEVAALIKAVASLGLAFPTGSALDFGCGVGRVTQALAPRFEVCYGVDIAPSMIAWANAHNRHGNKCRYLLNDFDDLRSFPDDSIDLVYSVNTFQNMRPRYAIGYIIEFTRILVPKGLVVFQMLSQPLRLRTQLRRRLPARLQSLYFRLRNPGRPIIESHGVRRESVIRILEENGVAVIDVRPSPSTYRRWSSYHYYAVKRNAPALDSEGVERLREIAIGQN